MYGIQARKPEHWMSSIGVASSGDSNAHNWANHLVDLYQLVKDSSREASRESLAILNNKRTLGSFAVGDLVYMNTKNINKDHLEFAETQLTQPFFGPFPIEENLVIQCIG